MATCTHHPKRAKDCVFCKYWMGSANMVFVNTNVGYKFETSVKGPCTKKNGAATFSNYTCSNYVPSLEAERLL